MVRWSVEAEDHNWSDINYTYVWVVKDDYKTSVLPFSSKFYNYSSLQFKVCVLMIRLKAPEELQDESRAREIMLEEIVEYNWPYLLE